MERRVLVVGLLATVSAALAAGALREPSTASAGTGGASTGVIGASGGAVGVLAGVLWLVVLVALVAGAVLAAVSVLREGGDGVSSFRRRFVALVLAVGAFVAGVLFVALRAFGDGAGPRRQQGVGGPLLQRAPEAGTGTGGPGPGGVLAVLAVLVFVGAIVFAYRRLRADEGADSEDAVVEEPTEPDPVADSSVDDGSLASAADRAASALDESGVPVDNDVLRAWRSLAAVLPVSRPATSTPREFADAATAAGVDREDVAELTRLFEAVRYGDREADAERTRRAKAALERIEAASTSDGESGGSGGEAS